MARRPSSLTEEDFESLEGRASKTEQKKAVQRMAALGAQLAELSAKQIKNLPVEERLIEALLDVQQISSHEARRRQFSRIGKLLRNENETVILSYLTPKQGLKKTAQLRVGLTVLSKMVIRRLTNLPKPIMQQNVIPYVSIICVYIVI